MEKLNNIKQNLDVFLAKYQDASNKFFTKQIEVIKSYVPDFDGDVNMFFHGHTLLREAVNINNQRQYDEIDNNIGIIYDNIGKNVWHQIKHTNEYMIYKYYSNIIENLFKNINILYQHEKQQELFVAPKAM